MDADEHVGDDAPRPGDRRGLVWFRRDLRLGDNPAWADATTRHRDVVGLFVLDQRLIAAAGPFRLAQLHANLVALDRALTESGGRLLVRHGEPERVVPREAAQVRAGAVYWNEDVSPGSVRRDALVRSALPERVEVRTHAGTLVLPPGAVLTNAGAVPRVFGAFHRRWQVTAWDPWPDAGPARIADDPGDGLDDLPFATHRPPRPAGEDGAHEALERFLAGPIEHYREGHDAIADEATSDLSIHLKFGTISPRHVVLASGGDDDDRRAFVRQLAWRDWFAHLLREVPSLTHRALRPEHDDISWRNDPDELEAWCTGRTGFPIVDAGMRELLATGSMHNRVRMIAASFLVKDLLVDWRFGERHFRRLLTDGDVSQNVGNWQWVAGTGPDAAPYFRVFNPVTQSRTHDPSGRYLRRWLPELAALDDRTIHAPWSAPPLDLAAAGVTLGADYPFPLVDHATARVRCLAAYQQARRAR
jgi:deoxyribodipyrimidine photo-lyase